MTAICDREHQALLWVQMKLKLFSVGQYAFI